MPSLLPATGCPTPSDTTIAAGAKLSHKTNIGPLQSRGKTAGVLAETPPKRCILMGFENHFLKGDISQFPDFVTLQPAWPSQQPTNGAAMRVTPKCAFLAHTALWIFARTPQNCR
jgi:hypothetical protein